MIFTLMGFVEIKNDTMNLHYIARTSVPPYTVEGFFCFVLLLLLQPSPSYLRVLKFRSHLFKWSPKSFTVRANIGSVGTERVLGNQQFQFCDITLIGLLPPQIWGGAYLRFLTNRWSWRCGFRSACPAPRSGRGCGSANELSLGKGLANVGVRGWEQRSVRFSSPLKPASRGTGPRNGTKQVGE